MPDCNRCGGRYELKIEPRTVRFGARREATVDAEFYHCAACGDSFFTLEQADAARFAASKVIRREEGLLMPEDIIALRRRFDLSQTLFQRLLGKGKKTLAGWESGADFQSKLADKFLRVIRRMPGVIEFLAELEEIELPARQPAAAHQDDPHHWSAETRPGGLVVRATKDNRWASANEGRRAPEGALNVG